MKKTLFLLAIAFGCLSLTSCARGYGCPYTTETKIIKSEIEVEKAAPEIEELEALEMAIIAD